MTPITVGITSRNRPDALARCFRSLAALADIRSVIVFDDASQPPVAAPSGVQVIRDERGVGYIAGRNRLVHEATTPYVLLLDDDTVVLARESVRRAVEVLDADATVGAVAFAQAEADGRPWPESMQPGRSRVPAVVPSFTGFAHLVRRDLFLSLGGYQESLVFYGEEKNFCVRLLDAGFKVVYLPDALIAHLPDPAGRSESRYVRYVIRNDVLTSVHTEPLLLVLTGFPVRLWRYTRMAKRISGGDPGGLRWILLELWAALPRALRDRRPVSWATIRAWRQLGRQNVPYRALRT